MEAFYKLSQALSFTMACIILEMKEKKRLIKFTDDIKL